MAITKLQDDLLHEFREEKKMIIRQIELFDPLAVSLRKPAAHRLAAKGLIIMIELLCWLLALATIAFGLFLDRLYPFYLLFQLRRPALSQSLGMRNVQALQWAVYALIGITGLLLLLLARTLRRIRLKNEVLSVVGRDIKTLVGQHLSRKAAIDAIEQRHFAELPDAAARNDFDPPNPGYDDSSITRKI